MLHQYPSVPAPPPPPPPPKSYSRSSTEPYSYSVTLHGPPRAEGGLPASTSSHGHPPFDSDKQNDQGQASSTSLASGLNEARPPSPPRVPPPLPPRPKPVATQNSESTSTSQVSAAPTLHHNGQAYSLTPPLRRPKSAKRLADMFNAKQKQVQQHQQQTEQTLPPAPSPVNGEGESTDQRTAEPPKHDPTETRAPSRSSASDQAPDQAESDSRRRTMDIALAAFTQEYVDGERKPASPAVTSSPELDPCSPQTGDLSKQSKPLPSTTAFIQPPPQRAYTQRGFSPLPRITISLPEHDTERDFSFRSDLTSRDYDGDYEGGDDTTETCGNEGDSSASGFAAASLSGTCIARRHARPRPATISGPGILLPAISLSEPNMRRSQSEPSGCATIQEENAVASSENELEAFVETLDSIDTGIDSVYDADVSAPAPLLTPRAVPFPAPSGIKQTCEKSVGASSPAFPQTRSTPGSPTANGLPLKSSLVDPSTRQARARQTSDQRSVKSVRFARPPPDQRRRLPVPLLPPMPDPRLTAPSSGEEEGSRLKLSRSSSRLLGKAKAAQGDTRKRTRSLRSFRSFASLSGRSHSSVEFGKKDESRAAEPAQAQKQAHKDEEDDVAEQSSSRKGMGIPRPRSLTLGLSLSRSRSRRELDPARTKEAPVASTRLTRSQTVSGPSAQATRADKGKLRATDMAPGGSSSSSSSEGSSSSASSSTPLQGRAPTPMPPPRSRSGTSWWNNIMIPNLFAAPPGF